MRMIPLISLTGHRFNGRWITEGEAFEAKPIEAASLTYRKVAKFAPKGYQVRAMTPEPEPEMQNVPEIVSGEIQAGELRQSDPENDEQPIEAPRRRRYRRRDMTAESTPE